ncbi:putative aminotransferase [Cladophialophora carrionii]|uniref:Putative aminotransferase n=1 Tax=Cladophialophora carrionii TaxID=86049 RepID=A0A1C1CZS4_9EURO|nr:putative aminotransferase [Cladophialophora carrionii]
MGQLATFHLPKWLEENAANATHVLGGSAAPGLSLDDLVALSNDPAKTEDALRWRGLKLANYSAQGSEAVRRNIADLYSEDVLPEHVVTTTGTTGANMTVLLSLVQPGDHVVSVYPVYPQLLGLPKRLGCEVSLWKLDPSNGWRADVEELRKLIKPSTKLIILNNPGNPTGSYLDLATQQKIIQLAQEHDITVLADEIFRPLYHEGPAPPSLVEHDYTKVVVTSSMSKVWAMSAVRIGWIISRDHSILDMILNAREYTLQSTSVLDEIVATEALSTRCRNTILDKHMRDAREGLHILDAFVERNKGVCSWTRPTAGSTAFIRFADANGDAVDDVEFCRGLLSEQGVLISPGSLGFDDDGSPNDFRGYVRIQLTLDPGHLARGLELIDAFLDTRRRTTA